MSEQRTASEIAHGRAVREMFGRIAGRYDLLNHVLSINIDKRWRRRVREILAETLAGTDRVVLDVACGTGDLALELDIGSAAGIVGTDFCRPMLAIARKKVSDAGARLPLVEADALGLPFADDSFDAVTIAFGLRNLANLGDGLAELHRVVKPSGKLVVLEFSSPVLPGFRSLFQFYFTRVLPRIGGAVSGSQAAYEYLPDSVSKFPDQEGLAKLMRSTGLTEVGYTNLTGGVAAIHTGVKPSV